MIPALLAGFFLLGLWVGFRLGSALAKTYRCQKCGEWDAEQERLDEDEERFRRFMP